MLWRSLAAGVVSALALGLWTSAARAGDTVTLVLKSPSALTASTAPADDAQTLEVRWGWRGYRGYVIAPRYYYGYYPRYYVAPRFRYYVGAYYRPYYAPPVYVYPPPVYYYALPVGGATLPFMASRRVLPTVAAPGQPPVESVPPPALSGEGTYPYDGGPQSPVPMPPAEPVPSAVPRTAPPPPLPLEGRAVSLPTKPTSFAYPAYGEDRGTGSFAADRIVPVKHDVVKKTGDK